MRALFIDFDGTLTDILRRQVETIYDTALHFGSKTSRAQIEQLCSETSSYSDVLRKLGLELTNKLIVYWSSAFVKRYKLSVLREEAKPTLQALSQEYELLCVTSRDTLSEVILELDFLGLQGIFSQVVTREVAAKHFSLQSLPFLPFQKQRRALYECALELISCTPEDAVAIGDMASELKPAKALGIVTIGLLTDKVKERELRKAADHLIPSLTHIRSVVNELAGSRART